GAVLTGLSRDDFRVAEDGVPQAISAFAAGTFPLSVALAIDRSFSMEGTRHRLAAVKLAAAGFVRSLRGGDQGVVRAIRLRTEVAASLSADHDAAVRAIERLDAWGTTPLRDAAVEAIDAIASARGRRALVILSDGVDRDSRTSAADLVAYVRRRDVLVYPIAV